MKFCTKCGAELMDEAVICEKCNSAVESNYVNQPDVNHPVKKSGYATAAKVFMILGTIFTSLSTFLIGLAWCLPLTIIYCKKINKGEPVGIGFKICSLLFVSMLGGIFMICDNN